MRAEVIQPVWMDTRHFRLWSVQVQCPQFSRASLVFDQMGKSFRELRFNLIAPGVWWLSAAAVACLF